MNDAVDLFIARMAAGQRAAMAQQIKKQKARRKPPRNKPCPCGSGNKFKRCCGLKTRTNHENP